MRLNIRERKSKLLAIRLTEEEYKKVEKFSKKFGVSKMEIGRALLTLGMTAYEEGIR